MESRVSDIVFEPEDGGEYSPDIGNQLYRSGYVDGWSTIRIQRFLKPDLSINLEKLELAVTLLVAHLRDNQNFDEPLSLNISGFKEYCEIRNISENFSQKKEEFYFIRGFIQAIAENETLKPVTVDFIIE